MNKLPSRFQIGESIVISQGLLRIEMATIVGVRFTEDKVFYDLRVGYETKATDDYPAGVTSTLFNDVDSALVEPYKWESVTDSGKHPKVPMNSFEENLEKDR